MADQSSALNALASFIALSKTATSARAAAELIERATSDPNTFVFGELLQQPNIRALNDDAEYRAAWEVLKVFAWGTWQDYKATPGLPPLSDAQARKLRMLSLITIASEKSPSPDAAQHLTYLALCTRLDLSSFTELEQLVIQANNAGLITCNLDHASQKIVVRSVAPLRDLAPGSVKFMLSELSAWSDRNESALAELESRMNAIKKNASKRARQQSRAEKQLQNALQFENPMTKASSSRQPEVMDLDGQHRNSSKLEAAVRN
ncbi:CSN7 COP9 signalosome subunit [Piedraia hortae CBS 480.64]|uniref:CSN7 COP9 signalosome subunit n=1 Tax=Piedraia hortae CBS 480.64 TaxID=1314780 RepID=A0A6A7BVU7_9PEZI|nr:CSN7 COP9 signalosome subunit [Piedraia hortae CBS 480.64]